MKEDEFEYNVLDEAQQIADDRVEYHIVSNPLSKEDLRRLGELFDSKQNAKNIRMFNVKLAKIFGLNEAILLHQLRGILKYGKSSRVITDHRGKWKACYNSYDQWRKILPMFSEKTLRRIVSNLEKLEILLTKRIPHGKYYGINFKALMYFFDHPNEMKKLLK